MILYQREADPCLRPSDGFLVVDLELWTTRDDYKAAEAINTLSVTNDHAERGVALIQDAVQP